MALIPGMEGFTANFGGYISQIMYWTGVILGSIVSMTVLWFIYNYTTFRIKVLEYPLFGSGTDGVFAVGKPKKNKVKWINKRTAWRSFWPLFNKIEREPFDTEYIYPGNQIYAFTLNGEWTPGRINVNKTEQQLRCEINPVPYYVRNWQSLAHKKNAMEFAMHNFWEDNKYFIMGVVSVLICCVLCGVTVYFTYKFSTGGVQAAQTLSTALQNFGSIAGK